MRALFRSLVVLVLLAVAPGAGAQTSGVVVGAPGSDSRESGVVVGVPIRGGQVGEPVPGVIIDLEGRSPRDRVPPPGVEHPVDPSGGPTTVRRQFGGGYTIEKPGQAPTTVRPNFGGGYTVETEKPQTGSK